MAQFSWRRALADRDLAAVLIARAQRRGGIAGIPAPWRGRFWIVTGHNLVHDVLRVKAGSFDKGGPIYGIINRALGDEGMFTVNNAATWKALRESMNPAFGPAGIAEVAQLESSTLATRLRSWPDGPVDVFKEFKLLNVELLVQHLFGQRADSAEIVRLAQPVFDGMAAQIFRVVFRIGAGSYARAIANMDSRVYAIIAAEQADPGPELLGRLLSADPPFTPKQVRDQVFTLFMAGFDSTATAQAWACMRLAEDADLRARLRAEVREVVGERAIVPDDARQLPQLTGFFHEVVDERPSFPMFFRNAVAATELAGQQILPGDQLIIAPGPAHLPFGTGKRKCIGEYLSVATSVLLLAELLRRYARWERMRPGSGRVRFGMTAPPAHSEIRFAA